jgi:hypothetical protein
MEQADRIITVYLTIDAIYHELTAGRALRRGGFAPRLSDVEVLTMEIIGELEGKNGDRAIWRYFDEHWRGWFPKLPCYQAFAKQCANLWWVKQQLLERLFLHTDHIHIIDGVPMPVCHNARAKRSRMLGEFTAWGYCASKDEHYYGLRGHVVMGLNGFITTLIVTPANLDERLSLGDLIGHLQGLLIGDKGFIDQHWKALLMAHEIDLQTPLRKNMTDPRPQWMIQQLLKVRKAVETTLSVLVESFSLTKIKAHDMWHFTSKITRKLLAYNFSLVLA